MSRRSRWSAVPVSDATHPAEHREAIRTLISRSARLMDAKQYDDYIALYAEDGAYALQADSDEIGQRMTWLEMERDELAALLEESPQHVHDMAARTHMVSVDEIALDGGGGVAEARSTFAVFRTDAAGVTQVYAVGRYDDRLVRNGADWRIAERRVQVQTRMFRTPTPTPL